MRLVPLRGIIEIEQLLNFHEGKPQALAAQNEFEAYPVALAVNPVEARACRGQQPLIFIEADGAAGNLILFSEIRMVKVVIVSTPRTKRAVTIYSSFYVNVK